jgi:hypothetical protein
MAKKTVKKTRKKAEEWRKIPKVYKIGDKEYPFRTTFHTDAQKKNYCHTVTYYDIYRKRKPVDEQN